MRVWAAAAGDDELLLLPLCFNWLPVVIQKGRILLEGSLAFSQHAFGLRTSGHITGFNVQLLFSLAITFILLLPPRPRDVAMTPTQLFVSKIINVLFSLF